MERDGPVSAQEAVRRAMSEIYTAALATVRSMLLAVGLGCSPAGQAHADTDTAIATGRQLASDRCSRCHGMDVENFILVQGALPLREMKRLYPEPYLAEALLDAVMGSSLGAHRPGAGPCPAPGVGRAAPLRRRTRRRNTVTTRRSRRLLPPQLDRGRRRTVPVGPK